VLHVHKAVEKAIYDRQPFRIAHRIVRRSGSILYVREQGHVVYGPEGEARFLEGMIADITEEQALRQMSAYAMRKANKNADRLLRVLEATSDCVFSLDRNWPFTSTSEL